ncbi:hypothetical protein IFT66_10430 [Rhizobium sp. CFBP 13726]|uniref:hypothetical protein n=1 Tax=Rhizobium sp. CFBP 13726 TaxID=2775296 RepID=UPI00177F6AEA|nr:hypothetical protein [Rhizobium sp. CFBP 13726]MBD8651494.1 hypothetical protein [Rhizobium sp. CFBP 13726]
MTGFSKPYVVFFEDLGRGPEYIREGYLPEELGGTIPNVGDFVLYPGVPQHADRGDAAAYTVYEVLKRYFQPQSSEKYGARIHLVVQSRPGRQDEIEILVRS